MHQIVPELLLGGKPGQPPLGGTFQVDRNTVSQLHGPANLFIFGTWHNLEVDVPGVVPLLAQNLGSVDNFVLGLYAAADNAGGKKQAVDEAGLLDTQEAIGHLIGLQGEAFGAAAPGAEGAVEAVALAGGGHHRSQHRLRAAGGHHAGDGAAQGGGIAFAPRGLGWGWGKAAGAGGLGMGRVADRFVAVLSADAGNLRYRFERD